MPSDRNSLPSDVLALVQQDRIIEAIKRLRETTGLDLRAAKDAVDAARRGGTITRIASGSSSALPSDIVDAMQRGQKIEAIRRLRDHTGMGLKEAKEAVDAAMHGGRASTPGEGSSGIGRFLLLIVVFAAGVIAYRLVAGD